VSDLIGPVHDIDDLDASGALRPVQRGIRGSQKTLDGGDGVRIGGDPIDPDSPVIATRSLASPISGNRTTNSSRAGSKFLRGTKRPLPARRASPDIRYRGIVSHSVMA
jgi:hypothetical protein